MCGRGMVEVYFRLAAWLDDDGPRAVGEDAITVESIVSQPDEGETFQNGPIDLLAGSHIVESYELGFAERFLRH